MSSPIILRQRSGPIITIIVWAFLALLLIDAIVRGSWDTVAAFFPPLALVGWLVFILLWRPAVIVGPDHVVIREILRTTTVPFSNITDIRLSTVVSIMAIAPNGTARTYRPWNAPGMPRRKIDSGLTGGTRPESVDNHPAFELLRRWENHGRNASTVTGATAGSTTGSTGAGNTTTVWNLSVLGVSLLLILLVIFGRL
ncbi:MAG: PH domain-containing protein [Brevibacterium sp.]|uniref:hypothetical protein n=1 Tax=Brevibacterium sp. TaxID=1701 RepID=UPI0026495020|nr:hypothetical protein [Brevibacterium sp.]MDN5806896.1 PH domain-containing protein [Brevibacterium sp.]MDN5834126.1 PH domain-containing protein [Brevibacterium sp.]MDN5877152.1 PH domain-containing protein [Brevibacterium sp.]MDN5907987.1 PH domain-containing protein [Brevibacterium sp.]MDN6132957.1 PH domain-containing protein [Brevibacterium sp.]